MPAKCCPRHLSWVVATVAMRFKFLPVPGFEEGMLTTNNYLDLTSEIGDFPVEKQMFALCSQQHRRITFDILTATNARIMDMQVHSLLDTKRVSLDAWYLRQDSQIRMTFVALWTLWRITHFCVSVWGCTSSYPTDTDRYRLIRLVTQTGTYDRSSNKRGSSAFPRVK